jgi:ADP-L-glycero-D-manno-heptose 6-epimerase
MENDGLYMMENNFTFSKLLFQFAIENQVPFVYASSGATYGASTNFEIDPANERPLNVYGYSKLVFDQHVRRHLHRAESTVVGLRYFNVYGPRETEKGKMASMVYQLYRQLSHKGKAKLFKGTDGYADGEQLRDFVYVEDVARVNLHFAEGELTKGIFNCGTGQARSFNDIANCLIKILGKGKIEYIDFPKELNGKYQSFTQADISTLRDAGFTNQFSSLEEGIARAVEGWQSHELNQAE